MTTVNDILTRPYRRLLTPDSGGGYTATIHEFPGCVAQGDTADAALAQLEQAARAWVEAALSTGYPIREPVDYDDFSGKVALRISRRLHKMAAECADTEGTSINQLLSNAISHYLGQVDGLKRAVLQVSAACEAAEATRQLNVMIVGDVAHMLTAPGAPTLLPGAQGAAWTKIATRSTAKALSHA
jgi:antitoxin HicB